MPIFGTVRDILGTKKMQLWRMPADFFFNLENKESWGFFFAFICFVLFCVYLCFFVLRFLRGLDAFSDMPCS